MLIVDIEILFVIIARTYFFFFIFVLLFYLFPLAVIFIYQSFSLFHLFFLKNFRISYKLSLWGISFFLICVCKKSTILFFILRRMSIAGRWWFRFTRILWNIITLVFYHFNICSLFSSSLFSYWVFIFWLSALWFLTLRHWMDILSLLLNFIIY